MEIRVFMDVTAKVVVNGKQTHQEGTPYESVMLTFFPDYADGRNKAWSVATPALSLSMTVKPDVARHFQQGRAYTLTFAPNED